MRNLALLVTALGLAALVSAAPSGSTRTDQAPQAAAVSSPDKAPAASRVTSRRILEQGVVEIRYQDGRIVRLGEGSRTTIFPNGGTQTASAVSAPLPNPPFVPGDSPLNKWLDYHRGQLLNTIEMLIGNDAASMKNVEAAEKTMSPYQSTAFRGRLIQRLLTQ